MDGKKCEFRMGGTTFSTLSSNARWKYRVDGQYLQRNYSMELF
jgi:hypothetical protein